MYRSFYPPNAIVNARERIPGTERETLAVPVGPCATFTVTDEELLKLILLALIFVALFAFTTTVFPLIEDVGIVSNAMGIL